MVIYNMYVYIYIYIYTRVYYIYIYIYMIERPLGTILFRLIMINFKAFWKIERI